MKLTESMKIDDYFKAEKTPGFYPSTDELNAMTLSALNQLYINEVCYSIFNLHLANLCSITFGFSNHMRSPPSGSYTSEPSKQIFIKKGVTLGCIEFGLYESDGGLNCVSIRLTD